VTVHTEKQGDIFCTPGYFIPEWGGFGGSC
jgi:hypothetical protein